MKLIVDLINGLFILMKLKRVSISVYLENNRTTKRSPCKVLIISLGDMILRRICTFPHFQTNGKQTFSYKFN